LHSKSLCVLHSYAASIHKAQGSTINHVFIIEDDILEVKLTTTKEKLQSINVGISRASYRAYIYNKIYKVDNSNLDKITSNGCTMKEGSLIFKLEHLDRYAIVKNLVR
jgi:ATP-dependent exoDNAse (exonuclease V) alpha subunit